MAVGKVTASLNAEDKFTTDTINVTQASTGVLGMRINGAFNMSISGTWAGRIHIQRSFDDGVTWVDVNSYTANFEGWDNELESIVLYRVGFKVGNYTSGTALVRLSK